MNQNESNGMDRRALLKGAAWSVPVIAAAVAAPLAAASGDSAALPNSDANYYWEGAASAEWATLRPAAGNLEFTFSAQTAYRADPWTGPPASGTLVFTLSFTQPVRLLGATPAGWGPSDGGSHREFTSTASSAYGPNLYANFVGSEPGEITGTATMTLLDGGSTTWTSGAAIDSGALTN